MFIVGREICGKNISHVCMYVCGGWVETHLIVLYSALPHNFNSFSVLIVMLINDCDYNIQQKNK